MVDTVLTALILILVNVPMVILDRTVRLPLNHAIQILARMVPLVLITTQPTNASVLMALLVHDVPVLSIGVPTILAKMVAAVNRWPMNFDVTAQTNGLVTPATFYLPPVK